MSPKLVEISDADFDEHVVKADQPVLVDFWAPWCAPCRMVAPIVEELAESMKDTIKVCKVNVDDNQVTAQTYGIKAIPTLILFKSGQAAARMVGVRPKEEIKKEIEAAIQ
jgi:thioredoxin 1